jgi:hypothetical protein
VVAARLGIAANLETTFLRKLLAGLAQAAVPHARVADAAVVEAHLLALLHDPVRLERAELVPVRGYLFAAGGEREALDRRRCQLAAALAHLFDECARLAGCQKCQPPLHLIALIKSEDIAKEVLTAMHLPMEVPELHPAHPPPRETGGGGDDWVN